MKSLRDLACFRVGSKSLKLAAACMLAGGIVGWQAPALAGSDHSSDTYSGDYQGGSLPTGTFLFLQYAGFSTSSAFVDTNGNTVPNSRADTWEEFSRISYFASLFGHPLVLEAELPFATLTDVNVPGTNSLVQGGLADPVLHATFFVISDDKVQRWLGLTNYIYLPLGSYDNTKAFNVATPHQTTDVPQIGYTEGLGKFSPSLKGLFFDFIGNASFHTDGSDPINNQLAFSPAGVPGVLTYTSLTQRPSYDVKAFLRYEPQPLTYFAVGIEQSWGGEAVAQNGRFAVLPVPGLVLPAAPLSLLEDNYTRGHIQFHYPLARDLAIASDIYHDFDTVGGFREDIGFEIRLTKFFYPTPPAATPSGPMYTK
jgi:hypothetical protein